MADIPVASVPASPELVEANSAPQGSLQQYMFLIGMGLFITTIGQPASIGRLPFNSLLKNQLHVKPQELAAFWALGSFAWYLKPLGGLICDAFPLFGTRRRSYFVLSSLLAAFIWALYWIVPVSYNAYFSLLVILSVAMVFISTVTGGLLVQEGQKYNATGRLSAMRNAVEGAIALITGPLGGWLATQRFGLTVGIGVGLLLTLVPVGLIFLREPRTATRDTAVFENAAHQFRNIWHSPTMWKAVALLFLVFIAPGFQTPLYYFQTDTLKFDNPFLGMLELLGGVGSLIGAALYAYYCRRFPLRLLLIIGIFLNAASTLFYLGYNSRLAAEWIEFANGLVVTLAVLPLYDIAARATPKGSESFGFALMMSVRNITLLAISNVLGSYLFQHFGLQFKQLVWVNAGTTLLVLFFVPFLPAVLLSQRDGSPSEQMKTSLGQEDAAIEK